ncbi:DUF4136 domain-containing protein [Burkholderia sp. WSM2232]|uniref:DUF4136 domain-containing protein n=1 Tax=Burkholderia sp. WSM2232 TaxID=944436 RepID=UPI000558FF3A|nr:DUF4136 domain-containing protein [Burkholderia sp. WSM2232]
MNGVKAVLLCAALAAVSLAGCTGLHADVHTATPASALPGERTYTFARMPTQGEGSAHPQFETAVRDELAKQGFAETAGRPAHYLLSVGYETRPAEIGVGRSDCSTGDCGQQNGAPFALFGARLYRHTLTLRFFERENGREVYKVGAASTDRDADPLRAAPALAKSALARFPFGAPADWRVKLRMNDARGVPDVVSVKPLDR